MNGTLMHTTLPAHIEAFLDPGFYPHPVDVVEMLQTHISWVFLAGEFAYKLKKPVNLGFLNFSTRQLRKHYCELELCLNQKNAPEIYLEVLPVMQSGNAFSLVSAGETIDYCLKMVRFDQHDLLSTRLSEDRFDPAWMDQLAKDVALFHMQQASIYADQVDHTRLLCDHIRANLDVAARHLGSALHHICYRHLCDQPQHAASALTGTISKRQYDGFIRHCHGDMHLSNITLIDGTPRLFDCIEFNHEYAIIDTMSDVAFLIMDCEARNHPELGMRFLSRYLEASGDYEGLTLLPYYCYYRAGVRGKVACLLADELDGKAKEAQLNIASHYFELACSYDHLSSPSLFLIGGLSGSGKSHLALQGCGPERAIIIRSDATRKRIAADYPQYNLYSDELTALTYLTMFASTEAALYAGYSVILDATFLQTDFRLRAKQLATNCAAEFHCYWLDIKPELLRRRISKRSSDASDISDADLNVLELQLASYQHPEEPWIQFLNDSSQWPEIKTKDISDYNLK